MLKKMGSSQFWPPPKFFACATDLGNLIEQLFEQSTSNKVRFLLTFTLFDCFQMEYLPSNFLGLDPLFRINVHLSISDILKLDHYPTASGNTSKNIYF